MHVQDIKMDEILMDPQFNCRDEIIVQADVYELMQNIEANGLLAPVSIMPIENVPINNIFEKPKKSIKYFLFAGFRRYSAFKFLKREEIPAIVHEKITFEQAEQVNLDENIQRQNLNILQEAKGIYKFHIRGYTVDQIAKRFDKGRDWIGVRILLLRLPRDIQSEAAAGFLNARNIKEISKLYDKNPEKAYATVRAMKDKKLNVDRVQKKQTVADKKYESRKFRSFSEVFNMQDILIDNLGTNLGSRALAWAMCEISTKEYLEDVVKECKILDLPCMIPDQYFTDGTYANDKFES